MFSEMVSVPTSAQRWRRRVPMAGIGKGWTLERFMMTEVSDTAGEVLKTERVIYRPVGWLRVGGGMRNVDRVVWAE